VSSDRTGKRREIEDSTAARLAEIVAAAEGAAKRVIDEAEAEARTRLDDAEAEAERIVAERLAGLAELTDEVAAQAAELGRRADELQRALARAKAEIGEAEALGGSSTVREPDARRAPAPSLTVVGGAVDEEAIPEIKPVPEAADPGQNDDGEPYAAAEPEDDAEPTPIGTPAGARLLATQMAVSGSSREEIESRLRNGFAIADTRAIVDAILGPEN
jgi:vacuolar-type H+-ATPase subunit H